MELSTLHIKIPHELHIALKVRAAENRTSMNQYLVDLVALDIGAQDAAIAKVAIETHRETAGDITKVDLPKLKDKLAHIPNDSLKQSDNSFTCKKCGSMLVAGKCIVCKK